MAILGAALYSAPALNVTVQAYLLQTLSLLDPGDLERNIVFLVRAVNALLAAQDPRLRDSVVAEWHREVFEEGGRDD